MEDTCIVISDLSEYFTELDNLGEGENGKTVLAEVNTRFFDAPVGSKVVIKSVLRVAPKWSGYVHQQKKVVKKVSSYARTSTEEHEQENYAELMLLNEIDSLVRLSKIPLMAQIMPKYYGCAHNGATYYIVSEYINGITLDRYIVDHLGSYDPVILSAQLINIIVRLHQKGIYHKDLHMGNIMVSNVGHRVYLIDFAAACVEGQGFFCGKKVKIYDKTTIDRQHDISAMIRIIDEILQKNGITDIPPILNSYLGFGNYSPERRRFMEDVKSWDNLLLYLGRDVMKRCQSDVNDTDVVFKRELWAEVNRMGLPANLSSKNTELCAVLLSNKVSLKRKFSTGTEVVPNYITRFTPSTAEIKQRLRISSLAKVQVISLSLFRPESITNNGQKYYTGLIHFMKQATEVFPRWIIRLYYDDSLLNPREPRWKKLLEKLSEYPNFQLVYTKCPFFYKDGFHQGFIPTLFRFLSMADTDASIVIFRDIDSIPLERDRVIMSRFMKSNKIIHKYCLHQYDRYGKYLMCLPEILQKDLTGIDYFLGGLFAVKPSPVFQPVLDDMYNTIKTDSNLFVACLQLPVSSDNTLLTYGTDELVLNYSMYKYFNPSDVMRHILEKIPQIRNDLILGGYLPASAEEITNIRFSNQVRRKDFGEYQSYVDIERLAKDTELLERLQRDYETPEKLYDIFWSRGILITTEYMPLA